MLRSFRRALRLGKERYWVGHDLEGNSFYELPVAGAAKEDWRSAKRVVDYRVTRHLSEYGFDSLPPQWVAWLRRSRQEPPSIEELQADVVRQLKLQENVRRLKLEYIEEKERLAEANRIGASTSTAARPAELEEPVVAADAPAPEEQMDTSAPELRKQSQEAMKRDLPKFGHDGNPSDSFQPESWTGGSAQPRRRQ